MGSEMPNTSLDDDNTITVNNSKLLNSINGSGIDGGDDLSIRYKDVNGTVVKVPYVSPGEFIGPITGTILDYGIYVPNAPVGAWVSPSTETIPTDNQLDVLGDPDAPILQFLVSSGNVKTILLAKEPSAKKE